MKAFNFSLASLETFKYSRYLKSFFSMSACVKKINSIGARLDSLNLDLRNLLEAMDNSPNLLKKKREYGTVYAVSREKIDELKKKLVSATEELSKARGLYFQAHQELKLLNKYKSKQKKDYINYISKSEDNESIDIFNSRQLHE